MAFGEQSKEGEAARERRWSQDSDSSFEDSDLSFYRIASRIGTSGGTRRGVRTRFKHVLKLSTVLCLEPVAKQFSRIRENGHQETAKNYGDERDKSDSSPEVTGILFPWRTKRSLLF